MGAEGAARARSLRRQSSGAATYAHAPHQGAQQEVVEVTPGSKYDQPIAENLLAHDFTPAAPDRVCSSGITCIDLREGGLHLAKVMVRFSRQVVGWNMRSRMQASLVTQALRMASFRRHPPPGLTFHSDVAAQTAATRFGMRWAAAACCRP